MPSSSGRSWKMSYKVKVVRTVSCNSAVFRRVSKSYDKLVISRSCEIVSYCGGAVTSSRLISNSNVLFKEIPSLLPEIHLFKTFSEELFLQKRKKRILLVMFFLKKYSFSLFETYFSKTHFKKRKRNLVRSF